jgi:hypothetical protein
MEHTIELNEKYFTFYKGKTTFSKYPVEIAFLINPSASELSKYSVSGARGYIDKTGNLYVEGHMDEDEYTYESQLIHMDIFKILSEDEKVPMDVRKALYIFYQEEFRTSEILRDCRKLGLAVQRDVHNRTTFLLAESYDEDDISDFYKNIEAVLEKARAKNPLFEFIATKTYAND